MFNKDLSKSQTLIFSAVCAFLLSPTFIVLHECGHVLAGKSIGWPAKLHYGDSQFDVPKDKFSHRKNVLVTTAGSLVSTLLAVSGFLWLRASRIQRRVAVATPAEWVATTLVMNVGRWLRTFAGSPIHPMSDDEAFISKAMGLPGWFLPYCLGAIAVVVVVATIRLHPPGGRLMPFLSLGLGGVVGSLLWMKVLGPFLLP
jgi:hypothetical protein